VRRRQRFQHPAAAAARNRLGNAPLRHLHRPVARQPCRPSHPARRGPRAVVDTLSPFARPQPTPSASIPPQSGLHSQNSKARTVPQTRIHRPCTAVCRRHLQPGPHPSCCGSRQPLRRKHEAHLPQGLRRHRPGGKSLHRRRCPFNAIFGAMCWTGARGTSRRQPRDHVPTAGRQQRETTNWEREP
jgi:hypothetical protein